MTSSVVTPDDLDWVLDVLAQRRQSLVRLAPIFWRPAPDALEQHRAYLAHLLFAGGARGYRVEDAVLVAAPRGEGWLVDDAAVRGDVPEAEEWRRLWHGLAADRPGEHVRFVCPVYETARAAHASRAGLTVAETWWLRELPGSGGGRPGMHVALNGADAVIQKFLSIN